MPTTWSIPAWRYSAETATALAPPTAPPPGHGAHRYAFQLFALGEEVAFSDTPGRDEVIDALRERAIASGMLIGTYERDTSVRERGIAGAQIAG